MNGFLSKMLYALTSAYTRKDYDNLKSGKAVETNIGKLFSVIAWGFDLVQEQADLIKLWDDLDYAQGAVLDRYGANFGVARNGASDALYRVFIRVKMIAQLSGGDDDAVLNAAAELLGVDVTDLTFEDRFPAKKYIAVDETLLTEERLTLIEQITRAIKRTMAAGVGLQLYLMSHRAFVLHIDVRHGSCVGAAFTVLPVGKDRQFDTELDISRGAYLDRQLSGFMVEPTPARRAFTEPVPVAVGAYEEMGVHGVPPDTETAYRGRKDAGGGALYHTHIKSKRIE